VTPSSRSNADATTETSRINNAGAKIPHVRSCISSQFVVRRRNPEANATVVALLGVSPKRRRPMTMMFMASINHPRRGFRSGFPRCIVATPSGERTDRYMWNARQRGDAVTVHQRGIGHTSEITNVLPVPDPRVSRSCCCPFVCHEEKYLVVWSVAVSNLCGGQSEIQQLALRPRLTRPISQRRD
jgi:hypothetical protein